MKSLSEEEIRQDERNKCAREHIAQLKQLSSYSQTGLSLQKSQMSMVIKALLAAFEAMEHVDEIIGKDKIKAAATELSNLQSWINPDAVPLAANQADLVSFLRIVKEVLHNHSDQAALQTRLLDLKQNNMLPLTPEAIAFIKSSINDLLKIELWRDYHRAFSVVAFVLK